MICFLTKSLVTEWVESVFLVSAKLLHIHIIIHSFRSVTFKTKNTAGAPPSRFLVSSFLCHRPSSNPRFINLDITALHTSLKNADDDCVKGRFYLLRTKNILSDRRRRDAPLRRSPTSCSHLAPTHCGPYLCSCSLPTIYNAASRSRRAEFRCDFTFR